MSLFFVGTDDSSIIAKRVAFAGSLKAVLMRLSVK
jgi:hypothetical protein